MAASGDTEMQPRRPQGERRQQQQQEQPQPSQQQQQQQEFQLEQQQQQQQGAERWGGSSDGGSRHGGSRHGSAAARRRLGRRCLTYHADVTLNLYGRQAMHAISATSRMRSQQKELIPSHPRNLQ